MNGAHLHLILNHFPISGMAFSILLLAMAWRSQSESLKRASLVLVVLTGLMTIGAFLTGDSAEDVVKHLPGITDHAISIHEEAAERSSWMVWVTSLIALVGLGLSFRKKLTPRWVIPIVLLFSLGCVGILAWSNNLGGKIIHSEIRGD